MLMFRQWAVALWSIKKDIRVSKGSCLVVGAQVNTRCACAPEVFMGGVLHSLLV